MRNKIAERSCQIVEKELYVSVVECKDLTGFFNIFIKDESLGAHYYINQMERKDLEIIKRAIEGILEMTKPVIVPCGTEPMD